jgi:translation initiation factor IF-3
LGRKLLIRFSEDLAPYGTAEGMPRLEGRNAHVLLSPVKASTAHPPKDKEAKDKPKPPESGSAPKPQ